MGGKTKKRGDPTKKTETDAEEKPATIHLVEGGTEEDGGGEAEVETEPKVGDAEGSGGEGEAEQPAAPVVAKTTTSKASSKSSKSSKASKAKPAAKPAAKTEKEVKSGGVRTGGAHDDYRSSTGVLISKPTAKDVKIDAFSVSAYGNLLVTDTLLELTIGRRYGLIGSNGSGKSSLLKTLAAREVPIPDHIDIFLLETEVNPSESTALQSVVGQAEKEVARLEALSDHLLEENGPNDEQLLDVYAKLEEFEPETFVSRSATLLTGLGFTTVMMNKKTRDLSGGWRMRVALAQALFVRPTLLLLDEPTNHLDLEACVWLEQYLATYPYCLVVVSHSQDFLNTVCTDIIHLTMEKRLVNYTGNYDQFIKTKAELEVNQMKKYQKEQGDIKHLKEFISSCGTFANTVKQAKSKQKILDKMEAAGLTPKVTQEAKFNFHFADCEKLAPPVLNFHNVAFSYSGLKKDNLYTGVSLAVDLDSRIALVGPNGAGKSTLLKLMCKDLMPTDGEVRRHLHLTFGRFHQHSMEVLDPNKTVLDFIREYYPDRKMEEEEWRKAIGRYGISGARQKTMIGKLSDGLKTRIVFAMLALERPNLLLLDEPTNHMDMECIDSLADAINNFKGGLVLVSHDFRLINQVAKEVWVCDHKCVKKWPGDIRSYKTSLIKQMKTNKLLDG